MWIKRIKFSDDINKIKTFYDQGYKMSFSYFDLIEHFYNEEIFKKNE